MIQDMEADVNWKAKVAQYASAGPVIIIKPRIYDDCKTLLDRLKSMIASKAYTEKLSAQYGNGPLKQLIDMPAKMAFVALKGVLKEGEKIGTWFPKNIREPGFSLHLGGRCVMNAGLDDNNTFIIAVATVREKTGADIQENLEKRTGDKAYPYPPEVIVDVSMLGSPMGKKPRDE